MATCPSGHESVSDDFCDVCGLSIGAPPLSSVDAGTGLAPPQPGTPAAGAAPAGACPRCGAGQAGQFCEDCGYHFANGAALYQAPPPVSPAHTPRVRAQPSPGETTARAQPSPGETTGFVRGSGAGRRMANWSAVVTADRDYFDSVRAASGPDAAGIGFPACCPERRFRLSGDEIRIGRRSASRGIEPEIDLTGPPSDPGISRLHAVLVAAPDGSWSVLDPGSANGTLVNGTEIGQDQPVPLRDGDRINLGAWTLVTISRE